MDAIANELKVIVRGQSVNETRVDLSAGKFNMIIDEPTSMGGTGAGPSPIQVILMSLAGCIHITGHMVAKQKGLILNGMKLKVEGVMNPSAFYGVSDKERVGFQQITVTVDADIENASQEEIEAWLKETEERCPVTDNIKFSTPVIVKN